MYKIYIIHYKELIERRKYLEEQLLKYNMKFIFIDEYDRNTLNMNECNIIYNKNLWPERVLNLYNCDIESRDLKISEICNSISHLKSFELISKSDYEYGIILEDDVILPNNFNVKIDNIIKKLPSDFDFLFFGNSYTLEQLDISNCSKSIKIDDNLYKKIPGKTRTVDGYIIKKEYANKMLNEIKEICLPFDFELNYFFKKLNTNVYWHHPGIIFQGSQMGIYKSSIR
jgi:GR25 family glycosyltransferase involved in LPS biosynthesis